MFNKGLSLYSSFTSVRNSQQALSLLQSNQVKVADLISHTLPLAEFKQGIELIEKGTEYVMKVQITPH